MKVSEFLTEEMVIPELRARTKQEVLDEFSVFLGEQGQIPEPVALSDILAARESLGSTGIGEGVAIPHGKMGGLTRMIIAFGRSGKGIDFDSLDGQPAKLFFLLVAPEDAPGEHLKALALISRLMKNAKLRESILKARDAKEIKVLITREEG
ncbi:MAG: PTS sugar transporter subunit IIA [Nitrospirota bacterium]